jgi:hypothetical protein
MHKLFSSEYSLHHYVKEGDTNAINKRIMDVMSHNFEPGNPLRQIAGVFTRLLYNNGSCPFNLAELQDNGLLYYPGDHVLFFCDYYIWTLFKGKLAEYTNANAPVKSSGIIQEAETLWRWFYPHRDFLTDKELLYLTQLLTHDCYPLPFIVAKGRKHITKENILALRKFVKSGFETYFLRWAFLCMGADFSKINEKERLYFRSGYGRLLYGYFTPCAVARIINNGLTAQAIDQANQYERLANNVEELLRKWTNHVWWHVFQNVFQHNLPLPRRFNGINAVRRAHTLAEEMYEQAETMRNKAELKANKERGRIWRWSKKLTNCMTSGWQLFEAPIELSIRGDKHHNCVGSYQVRIFIDLFDLFPFGMRTLLIYNKEATAELSIQVEGKRIVGGRIIQCKAKYNKNYDDSVPRKILEKIQTTCGINDLMAFPTNKFVDLENANARL